MLVAKNRYTRNKLLNTTCFLPKKENSLLANVSLYESYTKKCGNRDLKTVHKDFLGNFKRTY